VDLMNGKILIGEIVCKIMDDIKLGRIAGTSEQLISYVKDRPT
jgi:hypothetical protein